jgi:nickel-dependent lactate racemase
MTHFSLLYGDSQRDLDIPGHFKVDLISPSTIVPCGSPTELIEAAINFPISEVNTLPFDSKTTVAIAINDKTRPVPNEHLLPPLLRFLQTNGIKKSNIEFLIASGTHIPVRPDEFHLSLPKSIISEFRVTAHDCDDQNSLIYLGITNRNTPIRISTKYLNTDLKIVVGDIEPHHFAGFSGGVKTAAIGLTGRETIKMNHSFLLDDRASIARYEDNPLRQDIEEIGEKIGVDLALNAILNADHQIVHVLFGSPKEVMKQGIELSKSVCQTRVYGLYDLVIVSAGGYPKDINFYQAQKAISHACTIIKEGGVVILAAECREGIGSPGMERFMQDINSLQDIPQKFKKEGFSVGPHKALLLFRQLEKVKIIIMSGLDQTISEKLFMYPAEDLQKALQKAFSFLNENPRIAVMPHAINTIPRFD